MGQFSWIYSDTNKQLFDNYKADTYLLVPPPFQEKYGKAIYEGCYDGYGRFGKYDVYDLIAEWNREFLSEDMLRDKPKLENYGGLYDFEKRSLAEQGYSEEEINAKDLEQKQKYFENGMARYKESVQRLLDYKSGLSDAEMAKKYNKDWKREIGIDIACYDEQNASIPYSIKITTKPMAYETVEPSLSDPNQGWEVDYSDEKDLELEDELEVEFYNSMYRKSR